MNYPELTNQHVREIPGNGSAACTQFSSTACLHGTFVTGILSAEAGISRFGDLSPLPRC
jgi:hypothetical protein